MENGMMVILHHGQLLPKLKFLMSTTPTMVSSSLRMLTSSRLLMASPSLTTRRAGKTTLLMSPTIPLVLKENSHLQFQLPKKYLLEWSSTMLECTLLDASSRTPPVSCIFTRVQQTLEQPTPTTGMVLTASILTHLPQEPTVFNSNQPGMLKM